MDELMRRRAQMLASGPEYIQFDDPIAEQICATRYGDGMGTTYAQAAAATTLSTYFRSNTSLVSFDEFKYFTNITSIYKSGTGSNASGAFAGCTALTSVVLPNRITAIADAAFKGDTALTSVTGGGNITSIGMYSFYNCTHLSNTFDLTHITYLGRHAFYGCSALEIELNLPNLTSLDNAGTMFRASGIKKILSLGNTITSIPNTSADNGGMFYGCKKLTYVNLPSTITSITRSSFNGCSALQTFIIRATAPPSLATKAFYNTNSTFKIYVPYSVDHSILNNYKAASGWSTYSARIYELDENGNIPT